MRVEDRTREKSEGLIRRRMRTLHKSSSVPVPDSVGPTPVSSHCDHHGLLSDSLDKPDMSEYPMSFDSFSTSEQVSDIGEGQKKNREVHVFSDKIGIYLFTPGISFV